MARTRFGFSRKSRQGHHRATNCHQVIICPTLFNHGTIGPLMATLNVAGAATAGFVGLAGFVLLKGVVNGVWGRLNPSGKSLEQTVGDTVGGIGLGGN